jgi:hypothetical protein
MGQTEDAAGGREDANEAAGAAQGPDMPAYAYKPSVMGAPWEFRLAPDRLLWALGGRGGGVAYADIRRVRLSFRPVTMQSYRFITEIWAPGAPKLTIASSSWRGMVQQDRLDQPYRDFILDLHRRIARAGGTPRLEAGTPALLYWPGLALLLMAGTGITVLLARSLHRETLGAALFLVAVFALLLWQISTFFRRNRPRRYAADRVPEAVLPRAAG